MVGARGVGHPRWVARDRETRDVPTRVRENVEAVALADGQLGSDLVGWVRA
jgi:hypothetical protein